MRLDWPRFLRLLRRSFAFGAVLGTLAPVAAWAQLLPGPVSSREIGMGGAGTALADDTGSQYQNPASLATAGLAGVMLGWNQFRLGNRTTSPVPGAADGHSYALAIGTPPLGFNFRRTSATRVDTIGATGVAVRTFDVAQYAVDVLQTIAPNVVVGGAVKYVRGTVGGTATTGATTNAVDVDLGAVIDLHTVRLGLAGTNLRNLSFAAPNVAPVVVPRQVRAGAAVFPHPGLTLAVDVDLVTVDRWDGVHREVAFGGEQTISTRGAIRGGVHWNLDGSDRHVVYAGGASVRLSASAWLDGHYTYGASPRDTAAGAMLRIGF